MKSNFLIPIMSLLTFAACTPTADKKTDDAKKKIEINNTLSNAEIAAAKFTPEVMWKMGRVAESSVSPDGKSVVYSITNYSMTENAGVTDIYTMLLADNSTKKIVDDASSPHWNSDGSRIYFIKNDQLCSVNANGGAITQISDFESGIEGYGVAPTDNKVFFVKKVDVEKRKSADVYEDMDKSKARIYDDLMARHWNYWDEGKYSHIFVADLNGDKLANAKDIMQGEPWDAPMAPYFDIAEIAWNHAGTQLAYTCKKLTGTDYAVSTDSDIYLYDLATGTTKDLNKEKVSTPTKPVDKVEGDFVGYDKYPVWSPDDKKIAFLSMRRAGNESDKDRLFVWNSEDNSFKYLTENFDYNAANVMWNDNDEIYFRAPIEATHQICKVKYSAPQVILITKGDHDINAFTKANNKLVAELTKISMATELFSVDETNGNLTQISFVNKNIYDKIKFGEVQKRWVKTTDGKQMLVWVILPPDFDASKKYPTLLYCEGGPQSVVSQFWSYRWNFELMAAQGYVVVAPNRRGLPSFGQEWLDQISGDYSGQNIKDYLSAIDDVAKEPWCDRDRLGCVGASYGGYSVFFLAGNHNKRFKAFIAHCGIFNFESMYGETEELWFVNNDYGGPYWSDDATAKRSYANSPQKYIKNWDTPILIFTGANDFRIPFTQSMQAFTAARVRGIPSRLVIFENEGHQVFKPQNSLVWNREFFGWLDKYLKK